MADQRDIENVIEEGRTLIRRRDGRALAQIDAIYRDLLDRIEFEIRRLDSQILEAFHRNDTAAIDAWLRRQDWFRDLEASVQRELDRFTLGASNISVSATVDAVALAGSTGGAVIEIVPGVSTVNAGALERWVAAARTPGTPLIETLAKYQDAGEIIEKAITDGIGRGQGSSNITRTIMQQLEVELDEWKVARVVRSETMRAYRGAQADSFAVLDEQDVLEGYMWSSARDSTTCGVCLAMDGMIFPAYPGSQHVSCRCVAVPWVSEAIVPRLGPPREDGEAWLRQQSTATQKRVLGPARYDMWRDGVPLRTMVSTVSHPQWGDSVRFTPLRDLRPTG